MTKPKSAPETEFLSKVSVRPLEDWERERFDQLLETQPYLQSARVGGQSLRYVDESQYRGTCYRACGFKAVGLTAGFGRSSRDYYQEHGQPGAAWFWASSS
jgi:hypothetical protein